MTYLVVGIIVVLMIAAASSVNSQMAPWEIEEYVNKNHQKGS